MLSVLPDSCLAPTSSARVDQRRLWGSCRAASRRSISISSVMSTQSCTRLDFGLFLREGCRPRKRWSSSQASALIWPISCSSIMTQSSGGRLCDYLFLHKTRTAWCTFVGAQALPPLLGQAAARNQLGSGGLILFAILFLWQFHTFYAWMPGRLRAPACSCLVEPEGRLVTPVVGCTSASAGESGAGCTRPLGPCVSGRTQ